MTNLPRRVHLRADAGLGGGAAIEGDDIELSGLMRYVSRDAQVPEINLSRVKDFVIARKADA